MPDGRVTFDTKIDDSGFVSGLKKLESIGKGAISGLTTVLVGAASALSALGAAAISVGSDFEAQMSRVLAISGALPEEFAALVEQAKQLGADTAFSASEAAAGMENLASAGFTAQQILAAMPGLLDLAAVSGGDVAAASEVAASALNAFGLEASMAGHVANVFAKAAADTNAEALDMGDAMKYVAPAAKAMGISLEETAAAIGLMSNAGIKGSQAGTSLRGALSRIAKPTEIMTETMRALGIEFYDAEGKMLSLKDQIAVLEEAFDGLTQEERNQALVTLYGQESLSGMLALIEAGPESIDALTASLENSTDAAATMATTINDNLKGDIDGMMGSLETLGIAVYEGFTEPLRDVVQAATGYVNQLTDVFQNQGISGLASAIGGIFADIITNIAASGPAMIQAAGDLVISFVDGISENAPAILESGYSITTAFVEALLESGAEILLAGAEFITMLAAGISENAPNLLQSGMDAITNFVASIETNLPLALAEGSRILLNLTNGISQNLPSLVSQGLDALMRFATSIRENAPTLVQTGFEMLGQLVQGVLNSLPELLAKAPQIISEFANVINDNFPVILAKGVGLLWQIITGLIQTIPDLIAAVPQIITAFIDVWSAFNWLQLGKNAIKFLKDGLLSMVSAVKNAGANIVDNIVSAVKGLPGNLKTIGKNAIDFLKSGITGMKTSLINSVSSIIKSVVTAMKGLPSQIKSVGKDMIQGLWNGISDMSGWVIKKIKGFCSDALGAIKDFFGIKSPSRVFRDMIGKNLMLGLAEGIVAEAQTAIGAAEDAAEEISAVDFELPPPKVPDPDEFDYDALLSNARNVVAQSSNEVAEQVTASSTGAIYRRGNSNTGGAETTEGTDSNPTTIENNIYIDGKKCARVLTPYISKRMAWEAP